MSNAYEAHSADWINAYGKNKVDPWIDRKRKKRKKGFLFEDYMEGYA